MWGCEVDLILTCLLQEQMQSFPCSLHVSSSRSHGLETGCVSTSLGQTQCIRLPPLHFALSGLVRSPSFDRVLLVQPYIWKFHCSVGTLHLHMWKLSNVSSERLAFRERLLRSLLRISGALKQHSTRGSGLESSISVVDGISLHARPLFGR